MPNHVTTLCTITGPDDEIARFRSTMITTDRDERREWTLLDFNAAIPMPECLRGSDAGTLSENGAALIQLRGERGAPFATGGMYEAQVQNIRLDVGMMHENIQDVARAYLAKHPEYEEAGRKRLSALLETGYADWYGWSLANWGTKWNSYDFAVKSEAPFIIQFDTAWSFPEPVFRKIAEMFPTLRFEVVSFDEGWNFACEGCFNGEPPYQKVTATDELYERVYGEKPDHGEDEEPEGADAPATA